jgi:hypothetical protein
MLVTAAVSVLAALASIGLTLLEPATGIEGFESWFGDTQLDPTIFMAISWVSMLTMAAIGLVSGFGALALLRRGSWVLGLTAAILLCIPCAWPLCCPFPAGIGIWAIVVLLREDVRVALGRTPSAPPAFTVPPPPGDAAPGHPEPDRERNDPGGWGS